MRTMKILAAAAVLSFAVVGQLAAATPATEQAFLTAFKAAYTAKDANALKALVHTQGANAQVLDFYLMALTSDMGAGGAATFELQPLTPQEMTEATTAMSGPTGGLMKLSPTPYKKLVITVAVKNSNGNSNSISTVYVADEGDKLRIAAPTDVK